MNAKQGLQFQCPIDKVVGLFNKKWTIQIIRDMFFGKKQFSEFKEDKPNLSNKVLSQRLKELENEGIIEKNIVETHPVKTEYSLTDYGRGLNRVIYEIAMFSLNSGFEEYSNKNKRDEIQDLFKDTLNID
ncbi:transcriptional regulator [Methanobrevibacter sp. 87.7]|uniref:winged helix-turn-helix transcriptional regulator n=1 Tax=Methanobrevibacter sp. 87.7 TaxID=387957 RepID=UPI000B504CE3|nr:helix-turn-helix domain-containing protein [Methanobrevibacter sp. 87.7]OWT32915.1 transcriptional regulator [Methanobrevibacter sp. 87.7]